MKPPEYKPKRPAEQRKPVSQPNSHNSIVKYGYTSYCTHFTLPWHFLHSVAPH